ncbi:MAG: protein translocase subunit SecD [Deltaproteobacteria bacterium]|nr:protein translocase subunit SecD [Deltaproteobacteria bacterium]
MEKKRAFRLVLVGLLMAFCVLYLLPTFVGGGSLPSWYPFTKAMNYGLDLKGGLELRYGVDYKKAVMENTRDLMLRLEDHIAQKRFNLEPDETPSPAELAEIRKVLTMEVTAFDTLSASTADEEILPFLASKYIGENIDRRYERSDGPDGSFLFRMRDSELAIIKKQVVEQTLSIIRKRVDAFGLVEPDVRKNGDTNIDVQLPGVTKDQMDMVRDKIGQTARLTFRIVDDKTDFFAQEEVQAAFKAYKAEAGDKAATLEATTWDGRSQLTAARKSELLGFNRFLHGRKLIPDDHVIGYYEDQEKGDRGAVARNFFRTEYLWAAVKVSGDHLTRAAVFYKESGEPYVSLEFNSAGARLFEEVTREHVKENMAVMLDDDINSAPVINEVIAGGRAQITLGGARSPQELLQEAQSLVTVLTHGAYKAPVHKIHDHQVGPSLGKDTINAGVVSFIVGALLVFIFMVLYYSGAGVIADIALVINVLLILTILVTLDSALTLPGIAGLILTIGMAVDANVIINERIREELRAGKTPRVSIETGYSKAFWTIVDSQLTTAIAALVLLNFTSGPIYGFAVTLLIGIICSVFTALTITKLIFFWLLDKRVIRDRVSI